MLSELRRLIELAWARLAALLQSAPPGSLQLTGVLGLATLVAAYYTLRGRDGGGGSSGSSGGGRSVPPRGSAGASSSGAGGAAAAAAGAAAPRAAAAAAAAPPAKRAPPAPAPGAPPAPPAPPPPPPAPPRPAALGGVRRVTVSVPGVLLQQWECSDLRDAANARPGAAAIVRELARAAEVFLLAHVPDDVGAALVAGALEAAGVLGGGPGQVPPQRLLLCGTLDGKVSVVRQLEPELHIDASPRTVGDLSRFVPQLLLITGGPGEGGSGSGGGAPAVAAAANVECAASLEAFFNPAGLPLKS
jgi:hypothetical protein